MRKSTTVLAVVIAVAVVIGLAIAGWRLHWFLAESSTNHQATINQQSYNRQTALVDDINRQFLAINVPGVAPGQRTAFTNQICDDWSKLTPTFQATTSTAIHTFTLQECPS